MFMDAYQILMNDHRKVEDLFEKIEQIEDRAGRDRQQLFQKLREELELHTEVEERLVYPEMKRHPGTRQFADEALEEHAEAKRLLKEIADLSTDDERWSDMIEELDHAVQHHVREEEERMFPAARREISESRANELGRQIQEMKEKVEA
jgi:iron-sulfur cluster repair protein YtfE (RIC family)